MNNDPEEYHCYENESLTYVDENGIERYKKGLGKVIREYPIFTKPYPAKQNPPTKKDRKGYLRNRS